VQHFEHRFKAMGGPCGFRLDGPEEAPALAAIAAAEAEVRRLERKYSRYRADSLTSEINRLAGSGSATPIDGETAGLLHYAQTLWEQSGGLFDLTAGVLRRAWDFRAGCLPGQARLEALLPLVGWDRVQWDAASISLPVPGMELDFGGCVKEYAADAAAAVLRDAGIEHALVDLGGDLAVTGARADGNPWQVGIRGPDRAGLAVAAVELASGGLASSGDYERCIEVGGRRYGHILDPRSGWPVEEGLAAVSVTAPQCLVAGSAATLAMLKPAAEALDWLRALGLHWLAIDSRGEIHGALRNTPQRERSLSSQARTCS
jgi:thiamine biosynthesis lipoprotein